MFSKNKMGAGTAGSLAGTTGIGAYMSNPYGEEPGWHSRLSATQAQAGSILDQIGKHNLKNSSGRYHKVVINVLKNGFEVDGFVFHNILQLSHWLSQNLESIHQVESQEVASE